MKLLLFVFALICSTDYLKQAVRLTGASCEEDLSASEIERFEDLAAHPLKINSASKRELVSSGLFSPYQAASIQDYISRGGDICSLAELAAVDGIGAQLAGDLEPFVRLEPRGQLGALHRKRLSADAMARVGWRSGVRTDAEKLRVSYGALSGGGAFKNRSLTSAHISFSSHRFSLTAGDFGARFGQGLLSWTGFSMTTFYTVGAFARSGTGISGSTTLSEGSAKRGLAAVYSRGPLEISGFATLEGEQFIHAGYLTRSGSYGASLLHGPTGASISADWRTTIRRFTLFGEFARLGRGSSALRGGTFLNLAYGKRAGLLVRADSAGRGVALGLELPCFSLTSDYLYNSLKDTRQYKTIALLNPSFKLGSTAVFRPSLRINSRYRPEDKFAWRNDLRSDLDLACGPWMAHLRLNTVWCEQFSWLWYLEGGWKEGSSSVYLRGGLFKADKWNDRIYVYERDTPGSFNVPACYGRGWTLSLYARWRWLSLRAATTRYPWTPDKSPKYELKLQANLRL